MTRGDAIERLEFLKGVYSVDTETALDMAIESLQTDIIMRDATAEERASVQRYIDSISTEAVQGWIPCTERLPKEKERVLTYDNIGHIDFGQYDKGQWYWEAEACADYWMKNDGVLAWMPLPTPYKGGAEE